MTREEIENLSTVEPAYFESEREEAWYDIGLMDGLAAADEEPNLENLWHDVSEEPEFGEWFLAQIGDDVFGTFIMDFKKNQDWKNWCNCFNIKMWVYIDELLPKGSKK